MKRIISLCLALVLIFTLFSACSKPEPDRSYEKIAHEAEAWYIYYETDEPALYSFPPVTGYDDVVLYAKQYYYMLFGVQNSDPYIVVKNEEQGLWLYKSSILSHACGNDLFGREVWYLSEENLFYFIIEKDGDVVFSSGGTLAPTNDISGIEFDLSNEFSFSYDGLKDFESIAMFIEKLEPVTCARDVIERAEYLRRRSYGTEELNPYSICYDSENDCWLYHETGFTNQPEIRFVIDGSGQLLLFDINEHRLS